MSRRPRNARCLLRVRRLQSDLWIDPVQEQCNDSGAGNG